MHNTDQHILDAYTQMQGVWGINRITEVLVHKVNYDLTGNRDFVAQVS